jgi:hypothetical protein
MTQGHTRYLAVIIVYYSDCVICVVRAEAEKTVDDLGIIDSIFACRKNTIYCRFEISIIVDCKSVVLTRRKHNIWCVKLRRVHFKLAISALFLKIAMNFKCKKKKRTCQKRYLCRHLLSCLTFCRFYSFIFISCQRTTPKSLKNVNRRQQNYNCFVLKIKKP